MGRRKLADPRRVTLGVKVTEGKAAAVDTARRDLKPAQWLEKLIDAELAKEGISAGPIDRLPPRIPVPPAGKAQTQTRGQRAKTKAPASSARVPAPPPPARPAGAAVFQEPGAEPDVTAVPPPASARRRCTHPGTRSIGGFCPPCGHLVDSGGCWSVACEAGTCVHPK